jgi:hypothetical protein
VVGAGTGLTEWVTRALRHDLALPHIRVLLLFLLQASLREMFANLIFNVACWFVNFNKLRWVDDVASWYVGLVLGSLAVAGSSCVHILVYFVVF